MLIRSIICVFASLAVSLPATAQPNTGIQTIPAFGPVDASDEKLGSTMTLRDLRRERAKSRAEQLESPIKVLPADEPVPALSIQLYPARHELRPGQALLHFTRAQLLFVQNPREKRNLWQSGEWLEGKGEGDIPSIDELRMTIEGLAPVFQELHDLAMSDDFTWDHRLRHVQGPQVYMYLLPDVQEVRTMARMLVLNIRYQLSQKDFGGAFSSIRDGIRLAEFVGQGETLIQKLVGIAIMSMMRDQITKAIATPGCPGLYWALASIPRPGIEIRESVLWELKNTGNVLPVLAEAESGEWSDAQAGQKWLQALKDLEQLNGSGLVGDGDFRIALAVSSVGAASHARSRLLKAGLPKERLDNMADLQVLLIEASRELRRVGDNLGKAYLLPAHLSRPLLEIEDKRFQEWLRENRLKSVAGAIAAVLYPAVRQAQEAETRSTMAYNRLMTLEAIRLHAARHDGSLPKSLNDLHPVPAMPDPYTAEPFDYKVEDVDDGQLVTLTAEGPKNYKPLQVLRALFPNARAKN